MGSLPKPEDILDEFRWQGHDWTQSLSNSWKRTSLTNVNGCLLMAESRHSLTVNMHNGVQIFAQRTKAVTDRQIDRMAVGDFL